MKHKFMLLCGFMGTLLLASCSSDEANEVIDANGQGTVSLNVSTETGFQSRAVNESDYSTLSNYTVQILQSGKVLHEYAYSEIPSFISLQNGSYQLKAFYGEDLAASTKSMYVEGTTKFDINSDQVNVDVTCKPVCARVKVVFASEMSQYYSDYSIKFTTVALGETSYVWEKTASDPVYLKVNEKETVKATINLIKTSNGKSSSIEKTYTLSPKDALTLNVKPVINSGNVGITIVVDSSTNDIPVDIVIPSDWE